MAATPEGGTLSPATPTLTFTSGPHATSNPGYPDTGLCADPLAPCDHYALTVELPADYATTNPTAAIKVEATWPNVAEDFDFYLLNPDDSVKVSAATASNPEAMQTPAGSGSQQYRIRIVPYAVVGGTASVTVTLLPSVSGGSGGASGSETAASTMTSCQAQNVNRARPGANSRVWQVRCTTW